MAGTKMSGAAAAAAGTAAAVKAVAVLPATVVLAASAAAAPPHSICCIDGDALAGLVAVEHAAGTAATVATIGSAAPGSSAFLEGILQSRPALPQS